MDKVDARALQDALDDPAGFLIDESFEAEIEGPPPLDDTPAPVQVTDLCARLSEAAWLVAAAELALVVVAWLVVVKL